jgi:hypothetical protein
MIKFPKLNTPTSTFTQRVSDYYNDPFFPLLPINNVTSFSDVKDFLLGWAYCLFNYDLYY